MLEFAYCKNIRVEDVTLTNAAGWTMRPVACESVYIRGIRVRNPIFAPNTDGMDLTACRNVFVSDCDIATGDDAICIKSENPYGEMLPTKNITVTNCVLSTCCNGFKIGTATHGVGENIVFSNSVIYNDDITPLNERATSGIALEMVDGGHDFDISGLRATAPAEGQSVIVLHEASDVFCAWLQSAQEHADICASVPGTIVYTPAAGTVLTVGTTNLSVTFTPTDTTNYSAVTKTVPLTVTQAAPVITWTPPTAITFGTALSGVQLNASASVPGALISTHLRLVQLSLPAQLPCRSRLPQPTQPTTRASPRRPRSSPGAIHQALSMPRRSPILN